MQQRFQSVGTFIYRIGIGYGLWAVVLGWTIVAMLLSMIMTAIVVSLIWGSVRLSDFAMSALIAALVSPPIAYVSARLQLQLNMARHDLQKLVCEDALTGAATRTFFSESVQHLMGDNSRDNLPACMLMIDIDHFKDVNDTRGHAAGDEVLREFTSVLRTGLRPTDILGRYGGEEFAVLLPCTNATVGREVAERLRLNTFSNSKLAAMAGRSVTISVGMVSLEQSTDLDNMLAAADRALYRAKNQGRDQVCETVSVRRPEFRST